MVGAFFVLVYKFGDKYQYYPLLEKKKVQRKGSLYYVSLDTPTK